MLDTEPVPTSQVGTQRIDSGEAYALPAAAGIYIGVARALLATVCIFAVAIPIQLSLFL